MRRRGYDRGGITVMAASAIEMACWDLLARTERRPLHALLGGKVRDRVGVYAAGPYLKPGGDPYRAFATEAESYAKANFRAVKAKIGVTPVDDERAVRLLRHAIGPDASLMVDANQGLSARVAIETAQRLEPHSLVWFEEPVPPEDLDGYRLFAAHGGIAASGGEALGELTAFRNLLECGVTVLQPDLSICGGFCVALEAAALARAYGAALVPHVWGTGINLHAALQLLAVLHEAPNGTLRPFPWLELDRSPNPLRTLWGEPAIAADGTTSIPDGPGLGIDIEPRPLRSFSDRSLEPRRTMNIDRRSDAYIATIKTKLYTAVLSDVLDELGHPNQAMPPSIRPLDEALMMVGFARTGIYREVYRVVPDENPYELEIALVDDLKRNDIAVLGCGGSQRIAPWGELLSTAARARDAAGCLTDGFVRDIRQIRTHGVSGVPCRHRAARLQRPRQGRRDRRPDSCRRCGRAAWRPRRRGRRRRHRRAAIRRGARAGARVRESGRRRPHARGARAGREACRGVRPLPGAVAPVLPSKDPAMIVETL